MEEGERGGRGRRGGDGGEGGGGGEGSSWPGGRNGMEWVAGGNRSDMEEERRAMTAPARASANNQTKNSQLSTPGHQAVPPPSGSTVIRGSPVQAYLSLQGKSRP